MPWDAEWDSMKLNVRLTRPILVCCNGFVGRRLPQKTAGALKVHRGGFTTNWSVESIVHFTKQHMAKLFFGGNRDDVKYDYAK